MCDLAGPLLVVLDGDEMLTYSCFCELMKRMSANFPYSVAMSSMDNMDIHFANMRSLIQILDPDLFELMHSNGNYFKIILNKFQNFKQFFYFSKFINQVIIHISIFVIAGFC